MWYMILKNLFTVHQEILLGQTFSKMQQVHLVSIYVVINIIKIEV